MAQLHCYESCEQCQYIQMLDALENDHEAQRRQQKLPGFSLVKRLHNLRSRPGSAVAESAPDKVGVGQGTGKASVQRRLGGYITM